MIEAPPLTEKARAILAARLTTLVENYAERHDAACPIAYARARLAIPQPEVILLVMDFKQVEFADGMIYPLHYQK